MLSFKGKCIEKQILVPTVVNLIISLKSLCFSSGDIYAQVPYAGHYANSWRCQYDWAAIRGVLG